MFRGNDEKALVSAQNVIKLRKVGKVFSKDLLCFILICCMLCSVFFYSARVFQLVNTLTLEKNIAVKRIDK